MDHVREQYWRREVAVDLGGNDELAAFEASAMDPGFDRLNAEFLTDKHAAD